jgi:hypothetical protein
LSFMFNPQIQKPSATTGRQALDSGRGLPFPSHWTPAAAGC